MLKFLKGFERLIIFSLTGMMAVVLFFFTLELGCILVRNIIVAPEFLLDIKQALEIFGFFLLILIGIELLKTMKAYIIENVFHIDVVYCRYILTLGRLLVMKI